MVIYGSHDSCTSVGYNFNFLWPWCKTQHMSLVEQYQNGCRYFVLRYDYDGFILHHFKTSYTIKKALSDIISCIQQERSHITEIKEQEDFSNFVIIRIKRDKRIVFKKNRFKKSPVFLNNIITKLKVNNVFFTKYLLKNKGLIKNPWLKLNYKTPIILYSDDNSCILDGLEKQYVFGQIFNTVETWNSGSISNSIKLINTIPFNKKNKFKYYPKALFIDYSGIFPPIITTSYILHKTNKILSKHIIDKKIDYLIVNFYQDNYINLAEQSKINLFVSKIILLFLILFIIFIIFI